MHSVPWIAVHSACSIVCALCSASCSVQCAVAVVGIQSSQMSFLHPRIASASRLLLFVPLLHNSLYSSKAKVATFQDQWPEKIFFTQIVVTWYEMEIASTRWVELMDITARSMSCILLISWKSAKVILWKKWNILCAEVSHLRDLWLLSKIGIRPRRVQSSNAPRAHLEEYNI